MKKAMILTAIVLAAAALAFADVPGNGVMGGTNLVVAPDGTAITVQRIATSDPNTPMTSQVVAVAPTGAVVWSWATPGGVHDISLSGSMVLVSTGLGLNAQPSGPATYAGSLTALSLSSGAVVWSVDLGGVVVDIEPTATQIYALIHERDTTAAANAQMTSTSSRGHGAQMPGMGNPGTGNPSGPGTGNPDPGNPDAPGMGNPGNGWAMDGNFSLVAISNQGDILWTLPLHP